MQVSVAPLMMHIVTTRGGDKPNHRVTIKLKCSIKLKWPTANKLYRKAVSDGSQSNIAQKDMNESTPIFTDDQHKAVITDIELMQYSAKTNQLAIKCCSDLAKMDAPHWRDVKLATLIREQHQTRTSVLRQIVKQYAFTGGFEPEPSRWPNATLLSTMKFFKLNDDDDNGTVGDGDDNNTNVDMNNNKDVADTVYKTKS
ncbi:hypothetical protein G6F42_021088 [Rhizopus arrhizus]|nr:hypothetical protein G6F42_021088 [Rhizopus arrhizus]